MTLNDRDRNRLDNAMIMFPIITPVVWLSPALSTILLFIIVMAWAVNRAEPVS